MSNYSATVVRINNIRPHTNADRLVCTNIFGNNVIVGKDTKIDDVGLFFPLEAQIGLEFAVGNDLLRRKDEQGKPAGGMFDSNRRVRCQTFRGEKSMGFFIPINSLNNIFPNGKALDTFVEGQEIEEYLGVIISTKYVPKTNLSEKKVKEGRKPRESRIIPDQFRFHFDTSQLGKNIHKLYPNDIMSITWKVHGTSAIAGNCLTKRKLNFLETVLRRFGVKVVDSKYDMIYASRRVVKNEFIESKVHFYSEDLWTRVGEDNFKGKLHQGEQVYYEIVGYTKDGGYIQKDFDYRCEPGKNKIFVYRITRTSPDGQVTELQWNQVKERCMEIGVPHVPEIYYGIGTGIIENASISQHWQENLLEFLKAKYVYDQDSTFCNNKVPEEGICVRKEGLNIEVFKLKAFRFLEYETKALDKGEVDLETQESNG